MKPKEKNINYAGESVIENKKENKKPIKNDDSKKRIDKLESCVRDKDNRISKLEQRLNDRIKYFYTTVVIASFISLLMFVIYVGLTDVETFKIWMIAIGIIASVLGCLIILIILIFVFIWDDEQDKVK